MAGVMSNLRGLILDHHERGLECYAALLLKALRTCRTSTMLMFKSSTPSLMVPQVTQKRDV
uniref:Uncharacterized protein n=1 Tax=Arundo donax TaxID=35708 RepID=A0A0A8ZHR3_ARUDO